MGFADKLRAFFQSSSRVDIGKRFEILREAVSGTMSKFYKAKDRTTGQIVGLKVCDLSKTSFFEGRFDGLEKPPEGEIAMQFNHRLIVRTIEYGTTTSDEHFLVMEYLDGLGLNSLVNQESKRLNGNRLNLIRNMCEAVQVVHDAGFIHRDVCPRNFICEKDASSLRLIDFGLTVPATPPFMRGGNRSGTPSYMAPEIVRRRPTDKRLDIFALGVTAYQLCALELPWPSADVTGKAAIEHDTKAPVPITDPCPDIHPTLAETIMKCIQRDPEKRPSSADAVIRALHSVESETVQ